MMVGSVELMMAHLSSYFVGTLLQMYVADKYIHRACGVFDPCLMNLNYSRHERLLLIFESLKFIGKTILFVIN